MAKQLTAAQFLDQAMEMSGKTQREIARDAGLNKPNILTMMKQGVTKIPVARVGALAKACHADPARFLAVVMSEYEPEVWEIIRTHAGEVLSEDEKAMLQKYRAERDSVEDVADVEA